MLAKADVSASKGELELMIARSEHQGSGYGRAAVLLFIHYIIVHRDDIAEAHCGGKGRGLLTQLRVKIVHTNVRSIGLFESLMFRKKSETPNYFGELELVLSDLELARVCDLMRTFGLEGCRHVVYQYADDGRI